MVKVSGSHKFGWFSFNPETSFSKVSSIFQKILSSKSHAIFSGAYLSSFLGGRCTLAFCQPLNEKNEKESRPSEIPGYTLGELKEKKPSLFKYLYTDNYEKHVEKDKVGILIKARAFQELLDVGEEAVERVKDKDICIVLGLGGAGKTLFVSYLAGAEIEKKRSEKKRYYHYTTSPTPLFPLPLVVSERGSGTISPTVVQVENQTLVDMPGIHDTRGELITIANGFTLEKIINQAKSTSFVITVDTHSLQASRSEHWLESFSVIADSLSFTKDSIKDFRLREQGTSPMMVLVNDVKNKSDEPFTIEDAQNYLDDERSDSIFHYLSHLGYAYDPMSPESRANALETLSELKREKLFVKMKCSPKQLVACIDDLDALKNHLDETLRKIPSESSVSNFKKLLDEDILPCINYCDRLTDFSSRATTEKYLSIKKGFEQMLLLKISKWLEDAVATNNQEESEELCRLVEEIHKKIGITRDLSTGIIEKMTPSIVKKTNRNIAASLSVLGGCGLVYLTNPLLGIGGTVLLNTLKVDQQFAQVLGDNTPVFGDIFFSKAKLEHLSTPLKRIVSDISQHERKSKAIRDEERNEVKKLIGELNRDLANIGQLQAKIEEYLKSEANFFDKMTIQAISDRSKMDRSIDDLPRKEAFIQQSKNLDRTFESLIETAQKGAKREKKTDDTDSKIKKLKITYNKLKMRNESYMNQGELNATVARIQNSQNRLESSLVEEAFYWIKKQLSGQILK